MNILLIDDDSTIIDLLSVIFEASFGAQNVDKCLDPKSAIECLNKNKYDIVVCDYEMPPHGTGEEVYNHILATSYQTKFVMFSSRGPDRINFLNNEEYKSPAFNYLQKPVGPKELKAFFREIIDMAYVIQEPSFCPIRIHNFLRFDTTKCGVYVRLADKKYVKVLNSFSKYDIDFIDKYIKKNVTHFFIEKKDFDNFLVSLGSTKFLESTTEENFLKKAQKTHRYLGTLLENLGVSKYALSLANEVSEKVLEQAQSEKNISGLLLKLLNSNDYSYDHTYLITALCTQICKELAMNDQVLSRLAFVSLVHDIGITDNELCYIHDIEPKKINELSEEKQKALMRHHVILEKFNSLPDITDDVNTIMKFHHQFDEKYPFNPSGSMESFNSVVSIFLVAHCFSNEMYKHDFDPTKLRDSVTFLKYTFSSSNFKKIIEVIEKILSK